MPRLRFWPVGRQALAGIDLRRNPVARRPRQRLAALQPLHRPSLRTAGSVGRGYPPPRPTRRNATLRTRHRALCRICCFGKVGSLRTFQAPSMAFSAGHPWPAGHFLLLVQEKVTKEKDTPGGAPSGLLPSGSASGPGPPRWAIRGPSLRSARSIAPIPGRCPGTGPGPLAAPHGAPSSSGHPWPQKRIGAPQHPATADGFGVPGGQDARALPGPPYGAAGGGRKRRRTPSGDRRDGSRRPERWARDGPPRRPGRRTRTRRAGCPQGAPLGCPFSCLLLFGQAKRSRPRARDGPWKRPGTAPEKGEDDQPRHERDHRHAAQHWTAQQRARSGELRRREGGGVTTPYGSGGAGDRRARAHAVRHAFAACRGGRRMPAGKWRAKKKPGFRRASSCCTVRIDQF